jgi:hypothetical protein
VQATVQDEDGNVSSSHLPIYVLSGKPGEGDTLAPEVAYLSADKPGPYKPGDVLILSIVSPFEKAVGLFGVKCVATFTILVSRWYSHRASISAVQQCRACDESR